jgi:hypothetical protein
MIQNNKVNQKSKEKELKQSDLLKHFVRNQDSPSKQIDPRINFGRVRVGRYDWKRRIQPMTKNFENILIHVRDKLSPYVLKDNEGRIMENIWQFSKIYPFVPKQQQTVHSRTDEPGWHYQSEKHFYQNHPTKEYWEWRSKGQHFKHAIRYPVGRENVHTCLFVLKIIDKPRSDSNVSNEISRMINSNNSNNITINLNDHGGGEMKSKTITYESKYTDNQGQVKTVYYKKLNKFQGRLHVYYNEYINLAKQSKFYGELYQKLYNGINLQINEVDGPPINEMNVQPFQNVENGSIECTKEIAQKWFLNDKYSFGHGICLAVSLLNQDNSWLNEMQETQI